MSFILDALKKSESDRQRQSGPSLFEVKVAPPRRTLPVWALAIAVLLGINVIVISWMLLRHPAAQPPVVGNTATAPPARMTAMSRAPQGAAPSVTTSAAVPTPSAPPATPPAVRHAERSATPTPNVIGPSDDAPAGEPAGAQDSEASPGTTGDLPLYPQIVSSAALPSLHLDLHVFAQRPQDRFVMINMHRLREGDSLPNGVQVDAIRPDGVVLSYHGTRFLLPRN